MEQPQLTTCKNCGYQAPQSFKFCNQCGARLEQASTQQAYEIHQASQSPPASQTINPNHYQAYSQQDLNIENPKTLGILIWSIINTVFLFIFVMPILATINSLRARKTLNPKEVQPYKKKAILFNLLTYALLLVIGITGTVIIAITGYRTSSNTSQTSFEQAVDIPGAYESDTQEGESSANLPTFFDAFENSYSVTSYEVSTADDGTTVISIYGSGFQVLPFRNGSIQMPAWGNFESGGQLYESISATANSTHLSFEFDTTEKPEKIIILNGDTWEEIVTITP